MSHLITASFFLSLFKEQCINYRPATYVTYQRDQEQANTSAQLIISINMLLVSVCNPLSKGRMQLLMDGKTRLQFYIAEEVGR